MKPITLFLSTGRCGTQWLASSLNEAYSDLCTVTHEPLGPHYRPPQFFRAYDRMSEMLEVPEIAAHVSFIEDTVRERPYVETGWPCYAAIPLLIEKFGAGVRIVHLTRHPVPAALSLTTHDFYQPHIRQDPYTRLAQLTPECPGVFQENLSASWPGMSAYEKCLFWWTEMQLYASEIEQRHPSTAFMRVRMEDLFDSGHSALGDLLDFMGLPKRAELMDGRSERVDRWNKKTHLPLDWERVAANAQCIAIASELGYDCGSVDATSLQRRYRMGLARRIPRLFSLHRLKQSRGYS